MSPPKAKTGPSVAALDPVIDVGLAGRGGPSKQYTKAMQRRKMHGPGAKRTCAVPAAKSRQSALECPVIAFKRDWVPDSARAAYRVTEGRKRHYSRHCPRLAIPALDPLKNNQWNSNGGGHGR